jgi:hypothetical protein
MAIGNIAKPAAELGKAGQPVGDTQPQKRCHDTSRIARAKLLAKVAEAFPLVCPVGGGDIRLIPFRCFPSAKPSMAFTLLGGPPAAADLVSAPGIDPEDPRPRR